jgi:hypothetical protein
MNADEPLAFFITWTIYGTHLQGDEPGWRRRRGGNQPPQPRLAEWRRERLKYDVLRLSADQRTVVERECLRHVAIRHWHSWAFDMRSTHAHVVVTAPEYSGKTVRDQLKANATLVLRDRWQVFRDRPVWTVGGDWVCLNSEDEIEQVCRYVLEAQDRKGVEQTGR